MITMNMAKNLCVQKDFTGQNKRGANYETDNERYDKNIQDKGIRV